MACPSCNATLTIPTPDLTNVKVLSSIASSAAAKEEKHFQVPVHDGPTEVLIKKPKTIELTPKDGKPHVRVKTIRRIDCVEVGHDRFDEIVSNFLEKVGDGNVVSVSPITYSHQELATHAWVTDYGIVIVYRG